jgi:hypothetical protein
MDSPPCVEYVGRVVDGPGGGNHLRNKNRRQRGSPARERHAYLALHIRSIVI